jgi:Zn-dependent protease
MDPFTLIGGIAIVVFGITTHEAAHAYVADRLGDPTARMMGRLTLNPLPHIDLYQTIIIPLLMFYTVGWVFGGAKPVPVQLHRMRNPMRSMAFVAIAGPASNFLQALLWGAFLSIFVHTGMWAVDSKGVTVLQIGIFANVLLMVFNLMPIPPLDGSRIVMYFLKGEARRTYMSMERYGIMILIGLLLFVPGFRDLLWLGIFYAGKLVATLVQLPDTVSWAPPLR